MSDINDNSLLMNAFNDHFFEFLEDIESVFVNDSSIKKVKSALTLIKKMNPALIVKICINILLLIMKRK